MKELTRKLQRGKIYRTYCPVRNRKGVSAVFWLRQWWDPALNKACYSKHWENDDEFNFKHDEFQMPIGQTEKSRNHLNKNS